MTMAAFAHCMILLLTVSFAGVACGGGKKSKGKLNKIFIHGDPATLVATTENNTTSIFKVSEVNDFTGFNLAGGAYLEERSPVGSSQSTEDGNEAATGEEEGVLGNYLFEATDAGYRYYDPAVAGGLELVFIVEGDALKLTALKSDDVESPAEVLHYSVNAAKDVFSVLIKGSDPVAGTVLLGMFFTKNILPVTEFQQVDEKYKYLIGPGLKAAWPDSINVNICGVDDPVDEASFAAGLNAWGTSGKIGTYEFVVGTKAKAAPFTDVNARCATLIDGFAFENQEDQGVYGVTFAAINQTTTHIAASNIIISQSAFAKSTGLTVETRDILMKYVVSHEFGHFLGLDHEFTKDADGAQLYPSIMSYDDSGIEDYTPRAHDEESIALLYGEAG